MTLSTEQGFPLWLAIGMILRGGTLAEQGQVAERMAQMCQGLAIFQATGVELDFGHSRIYALQTSLERAGAVWKLDQVW